MNERFVMFIKLILVCSACLAIGLSVIYVLKNWLGWL